MLRARQETLHAVEFWTEITEGRRVCFSFYWLELGLPLPPVTVQVQLPYGIQDDFSELHSMEVPQLSKTDWLAHARRTDLEGCLEHRSGVNFEGALKRS